MTTRQVAIRVKTDGKAEVQRDFREVGKAGSDAYKQIGDASDQASRAADRQMEKWKQLARAAREDENRQAAQAKFNALLGVGGGGKSAKDSASVFAENPPRGKFGFNKQLTQTAVYTASDVVASVGSGASPAMVALQQGPQILQTLILNGGMAVGTMLKLAAGFGTVAGAALVATAAWNANQKAMGDLDNVAKGLGGTAGLTADQINALATKAGAAAGLTVGASREMASAYLSTGQIGGEVTTKLIGVTERYAVVTGQDAKSATKDLANAMADPAKGMEVLNDKLRFLDDSTVRYIRSLLEQNRVTDAQMVLADKLGGRLQTTATHVTKLGEAWAFVKQKASEAWAAIGRSADAALGGGADAERLVTLTKELGRLPEGKARDKRRDEIKAEIDAINARSAARKAEAEQQRKNDLATDARAVQDRINPKEAQLRSLRTDRSVLAKAIKDGALADPVQATADLAKLDKQIADVAKGYGQAATQTTSFGRAQRQASQSASAAARDAARDAEQAARQAERLNDLKLRNQLSVAQAGGDEVKIAEVRWEMQLRSLIADFRSAGLDITQATLEAERQMAAETQAAYQSRLKALPGLNDNIVPTEQVNKGWNDLKLSTDSSAEAANSMKWAYVSAFDEISNALASGEQSWKNWGDIASSALRDVLATAVKLALLNPLKNALFGGMTGWVPLPSFSFGRNADGTDYWRGGLTWVGERGPELVNLPRGSQVFSAPQSAQMAGGAPQVSIHLDARGAGPNEVQALKSEVASLKQALPSIIVQVSNDAKSRRLIRG